MNIRLIKTLAFAACLLLSLPSFSQTEPCAIDFDVNVYNGTVNGLFPNIAKDSILRIFPCLVQTDSSRPIGTEGVQYLKCEGITFNFTHQYIEIDSNYTSKISANVLNAHIRQAVWVLGKPFYRDIPADIEPQIVFYFYPTDYGCLRLNYDFNTGNVTGLAFHAKPIEEALKDINRKNYEGE